jgi:hypothetical protein
MMVVPWYSTRYEADSFSEILSLNSFAQPVTTLPVQLFLVSIQKQAAIGCRFETFVQTLYNPRSSVPGDQSPHAEYVFAIEIFDPKKPLLLNPVVIKRVR